MKKRRKQEKRNFLPIILAPIIIGLSFLFDKIFVRLANMIQYPLLFTFFYNITLLGESYMFVWLAIILTAILLTYRRPITAFILTLGATAIMSWLIKIIVNRPRPFESMHATSMVTTSLSSFPSGHTMMFFSMIPIMVKNFPKARIVFWTVAILVGISRIYLGVHYFSDVIAGAIFGYTIGWICMKIGEKYEWKY